MDVKTFGEVITGLRKQTGLSQPWAAKKIDVSQGTISNWERGYCEPRRFELTRLLIAYRVKENLWPSIMKAPRTPCAKK